MLIRKIYVHLRFWWSKRQWARENAYWLHIAEIAYRQRPGLVLLSVYRGPDGQYIAVFRDGLVHWAVTRRESGTGRRLTASEHVRLLVG